VSVLVLARRSDQVGQPEEEGKPSRENSVQRTNTGALSASVKMSVEIAHLFSKYDSFARLIDNPTESFIPVMT
jgi:hypothetical protein